MLQEQIQSQAVRLENALNTILLKGCQVTGLLAPNKQRRERLIDALVCLAVILVSLYGDGSGAAAQPRTMSASNAGDVTFRPVSELNQDTASPKLGNAEPADPGQWLATFFSWSGRFECTSTLIGPQTLLTAAHCVGPGKDANIVAGITYTGACSHHPDYPADPSADFALCRMSKPVPGIPYENINADPNSLKVGIHIRLTGYGCTTKTGAGPIDGIYRIGIAPITALPGELANEPNSIITATTLVEDAILCRGDSGGPAFIESEMSSARKVISVNSRVWPEQRRSYLSSLTSKKAWPWINAWSEAKTEQRICGLPDGPEGCR